MSWTWGGALTGAIAGALYGLATGGLIGMGVGLIAGGIGGGLAGSEAQQNIDKAERQLSVAELQRLSLANQLGGQMQGIGYEAQKIANYDQQGIQQLRMASVANEMEAGSGSNKLGMSGTRSNVSGAGGAAMSVGSAFAKSLKDQSLEFDTKMFQSNSDLNRNALVLNASNIQTQGGINMGIADLGVEQAEADLADASNVVKNILNTAIAGVSTAQTFSFVTDLFQPKPPGPEALRSGNNGGRDPDAPRQAPVTDIYTSPLGIDTFTYKGKDWGGPPIRDPAAYNGKDWPGEPIVYGSYKGKDWGGIPLFYHEEMFGWEDTQSYDKPRRNKYGYDYFWD